LYGSWIQWDQVEELRHREMLHDARAIIRLRRRYAGLIRPLQHGGENRVFFPVGDSREAAVGSMYGYCNESRLLVVAGNPSIEADVDLRFTIPWHELPIGNAERYMVTDVWNEVEGHAMTREQLAEHTWKIRRDNTLRGGLGVWEVVRQPVAHLIERKEH
jgi:hypothetical protein